MGQLTPKRSQSNAVCQRVPATAASPIGDVPRVQHARMGVACEACPTGDTHRVLRKGAPFGRCIKQEDT